MNDFQLTDVDRRILHELSVNGRIPYKELSARTGVPMSTCHGRVRALENARVIRGYRADIDPAAAGLGVEALISVSVNGRHRKDVPAITEQFRAIPGVQSVFLIGGDRDLIMHVACESVPALRDLLSRHLGTNQALEQTHTNLVFEHLPGLAPA